MDRPDSIKGVSTRVKTGCGNMYLTDCSSNPYKEIRALLGKGGGCPTAFLQALTSTASLALRAGVPMEEIIEAWSGIGCPQPMWNGPVQVLSCPDAMARVLKKNLGQEETKKSTECTQLL